MGFAKSKIIYGLFLSFFCGLVYAVDEPAKPGELSPAEIDHLLSRYKGQIGFANAGQSYGGGVRLLSAGLESAEPMLMVAAAAPDAGGEKREQQESDIYKLGPVGSKILYYLNTYRGLQTISFKDGVEKPALLSRAAASGNNPNDMYVDLKNSRLVIVETAYVDQNGLYQYNDPGSRLIIYDISNPEKPVLKETLSFAGQVADSRLVGDILYVATSETPSYYMNSGDRPEPKGKVFSFSLGSESVSQVEELELTLPASRRENMGIVEVEENGKYKYYLTAVLSKSGYGWGDRNSLVEVVDISNPKGKIKSLMYVSAKGFINQRSWVTLKDGNLIVTSNYTTGENSWSGLQRVAVESFKLPNNKTKPLSHTQAQYRTKGIEAKLEGLEGDALDEATAKLIVDKELGLKGHFFLDEDGKIQKLVPDSVKTVGDTTGQSARLQSVRYVGNQIYVFWVPANQVDPFDLFDISNPSEIKFVRRLQFDGWVQRADPIEYKGRKFVLGLGYIVPIEDNERNRRYPQAMLFEIIGEGKEAKTVTIAQKTLGNFWADLSAQDKFFDLRLGADGKGSILFQVATTGGVWKSGGKIIGFDLEKALTEKPKDDEVFQEGGLLSGSSGWLKRVFKNVELDRVQTLSDKALGTFNLATTGIGDPKDVLAAAHILELARNIRGYVNFSEGDASVGVQIISDYNWYGSSEEQKTTLRLVPSDKADAELQAVLEKKELEGTYIAHHQSADGKNLIVFTQQTENKNNEYNVYYHLHVFAYKNGKLETSSTSKWTPEERPHLGRVRTLNYLGLENIIEVNSKTFLISLHGQIKELQLKEKPELVDIDTDIGLKEDDGAPRLFMLNGNPHLMLSKSVGKKGSLNITQHFLAPLIRIGEGKWSLGDKVNIPGDPVALLSSGALIVEDNILKDIDVGEQLNRRGQPDTKTVFEKVLVALDAPTNLLTAAWRLTDFYPRNDGSEWMQAGDRLVRLEQENRGNFAYPMFGYGRGRGGYSPSNVANLRMLGVGADGSFVSDLKLLRGFSLPGDPTIRNIFQNPKAPGTIYAVLSSGTKAQIFSWDDGNKPEPLAQNIVPLSEALERLPASTVFDIPSRWWNYGQGENFSFDPKTGSLVFPAGDAGACQVFLERIAPPATLASADSAPAAPAAEKKD